MVRNILMVLCGFIILAVSYNVLVFVLSRFFSIEKIRYFLKNRGLIPVVLNIILLVTSFMSILVLNYFFEKLSTSLVISCVILYTLFVLQNIFSRIRLIEAGQSRVKDYMSDPENYDKSNDLKKEYWRLFYEIIGLVLGIVFIIYF